MCSAACSCIHFLCNKLFLRWSTTEQAEQALRCMLETMIQQGLLFRDGQQQQICSPPVASPEKASLLNLGRMLRETPGATVHDHLPAG